MHKITIDDDIRQRGEILRGLGRSPLPFDPAKTAHVIVDLQNGFMAEGAPVELAAAREIVPNVNRISQAQRAAGGVNAFLRWTTDHAKAPAWPSMWDVMSEDARAALVEPFKAGTWYHDLWDGLDRTPADLVVDKARFSGFVQGSSDLHDLLQPRGIEAVIITGCVTNCCCESTARVAMEIGYHVYFIEDGNAAMSDKEHNATLETMCGMPFAEVLSTEAMVARIQAAALSKAA